MFVPRTSKLVGLLNISYIVRKSQPLGTYFKNLVYGIPDVILWSGIQEGKEKVIKKEFFRLGATAACVMRGVIDIASGYSYIESPKDESGSDDTDESAPPVDEVRKRLYLADSWFESVKTAETFA